MHGARGIIGKRRMKKSMNSRESAAFTGGEGKGIGSLFQGRRKRPRRRHGDLRDPVTLLGPAE